MNFLIDNGYHKKTAQYTPGESFPYWREIICDEFIQLECERKEAGPFNGELRGGVSIGDLRFAEVISDPQKVLRSKHQISQALEEDFLISFQVSNKGMVKQNGRVAILNPGSFALYDSTQPYSLTFDERFHQLVVQMPKKVLSRHLMNPEQYTAIPIAGTTGLGAILTNLIFSLAQEVNNLQQAPADLSESLVNMIAMAFSSSVMLEQVGGNSLVQESIRQRIRLYIDNSFCNPGLNNGQIAKAMGISNRYLHKLFQNESETIHTRIINQRLERAARLLADPTYVGHSIESIAYSVGFSSAAHFSRSFKKRYGISPRESRGNFIRTC